MQELRDLILKTDCESCVHKCCSQPYDSVLLTAAEASKLSAASGLSEQTFSVLRRNENTSHIFRILNLPCRFFDPQTGYCGVYQDRPLGCRLFPLHVEASTGEVTLLPTQCGPHLHVLPSDAEGAYRLADFEGRIRDWLAELWRDADPERY